MTGRIGICIPSLNTNAMTYSHLVLNVSCSARLKVNMNRLQIAIRVSRQDVEKIKNLAKKLNLSVQEYLYQIALAYEPVRDLRVNVCRNMKNVQMKKANDFAWQLKLYATTDPDRRPPEVRFWGYDTVQKRLNDLLTQLLVIEESMNQASSMPAIKIIDESRNDDSLNCMLKLRVTETEKQLLLDKSRLCCLSLSAYLRYLGTGNYPQGRESIQVGEDILSVVADLGRIKGIIKYIFSPNRIHHISSRPFISNAKTVYKVVEKALLLQSKGREILKGIV